MTWNDKAAEVFADPKKLKQAVGLWLLVEGHLQHCQHKRMCPEESLAHEAERISRLIDGHPDTARLDRFARMLRCSCDLFEFGWDDDVGTFCMGDVIADDLREGLDRLLKREIGAGLQRCVECGQNHSEIETYALVHQISDPICCEIVLEQNLAENVCPD